MARKKKEEGAPPAPPLTKRERFQKYAERRTNNALKALRNVARMGNRASYEYTDAEADAIQAAIEDACKKTYEAFLSKDNATKNGFKLF